ncbi:MAG: hypothetical protein ACO35E_11470, partial [Ilumatobacteraceae bacterium]
MRGITRPTILLTVAVLAATIGFTAPGGSSVGALTDSIWDRVLPSDQRVMGVSLSADGSKGFLASTHNAGV